MAGAIAKPKPLKIYGRSHYACTRCKLSKVKCSGERPACSNCKNVNKADACTYPTKDRKIVIMESDLNKLQERVEYLENFSQVTKDKRTTFGSKSYSSPDLVYSRSPSPDTAVDQDPEYSEAYSEQKQDPVANDKINSNVLSFSASSKPQESYRSSSTRHDDFFRSDFQSELLHIHILKACKQKLPERSYAQALINEVQASYCSQFYLVNVDQLNSMVEKIYSFFEDDTAPLDSLLQIVPQKSLCFFFIVLAFGEQLINTSEDPKHYPGIEFYYLSGHLFKITDENIDILFVQTALLFGLYSSNLNLLNTAYNFVGIGTKSSLSQGFHRQKERRTVSDLETLQDRVAAEQSKRLWWTVFVIDTLLATKAISLQYTDTDVDLPSENCYELGDSFDTELLETNVHLSKYVAKYVRLIYGPNIRTFSINYINTAQFNQRLLVKNIIQSSRDLILYFEAPYLTKFTAANLIIAESRSVATLFLSYHHLVLIITKPLLSIIFDPNTQSIENIKDIEAAISKCIFIACTSIDIIARLFTYQKLFLLGRWDSHYLYSSILMIIIAGIEGKNFTQLATGIAILKYMASKHNVNAKQNFSKLVEIDQILKRSPRVNFEIDLDVSVESIAINFPLIFPQYAIPLNDFVDDPRWKDYRFSAEIKVYSQPFRSPMMSTAHKNGPQNDNLELISKIVSEISV